MNPFLPSSSTPTQDTMTNYDIDNISDLVPFEDFDITAYMTFDNASLDDLNFDFIPEPAPNPIPVPKPIPTGTPDLLPSTTGFTTTITTTTSSIPGYIPKCINISKALQIMHLNRTEEPKPGAPHSNKFDMRLAIIEMLEQWHGKEVPELKNIKRQLIGLWPISPNLGERWYYDQFREIDEAVTRFLDFQTAPPLFSLKSVESLQLNQSLAPKHMAVHPKGDGAPAQVEVQKPKTTHLELQILAGAPPRGPTDIKHFSLAISNVVQHIALLKIEDGLSDGEKSSKEEREAGLALRRSQRQLEARARKRELKRAEKEAEQNAKPSVDWKLVDRNDNKAAPESNKKRSSRKRRKSADMSGMIEEKLILVDNRPRMLFRRKVPTNVEGNKLGQTPTSSHTGTEVATSSITVPKQERKRKRKRDLATPPSSSGTTPSGSEIHNNDPIPIPKRKRGRPTKKKVENEHKAQ